MYIYVYIFRQAQVDAQTCRRVAEGRGALDVNIYVYIHIMYVYIKKICLENFVTLMNKNIMNRINKINLKDIKKNITKMTIIYTVI